MAVWASTACRRLLFGNISHRCTPIIVGWASRVSSPANQQESGSGRTPQRFTTRHPSPPALTPPGPLANPVLYVRSVRASASGLGVPAFKRAVAPPAGSRATRGSPCAVRKPGQAGWRDRQRHGPAIHQSDAFSPEARAAFWTMPNRRINAISALKQRRQRN